MPWWGYVLIGIGAVDVLFIAALVYGARRKSDSEELLLELRRRLEKDENGA